MATYTDAEVIKVMLRAAERFPHKGVENCATEVEARANMAQSAKQNEYIRQQLPELDSAQQERCSSIIGTLYDDGEDDDEEE